MSLTSILKDSRSKPLRVLFNQYFPTPSFKADLKIIAPPLTKNYGLIGGAFDYLLRFWFRYNFKERCQQLPYFIADKAVIRLKDYRKNGKVMISDSELDSIQLRLKNCHEICNKYNQRGKINDDLLKACIFMAKLDNFYRSGILDKEMHHCQQEDIVDLKNLIGLAKPEKFAFDGLVYLNPEFGKASNFVKGADADIIMGNVLLEVKTTKELKLNREYIDQLIGYILLMHISGINGQNSNNKVDFIGVYFSRYGYLWKYPVLEYLGPKELQKLRSELIHFVKAYYNAKI